MRVLAFLVVVLGSALPGWAQDAASGSEAVAQSVPAVTVAPARRAEVQARVPVSGTLVARQKVQVFPQVSGYEITEILVEADLLGYSTHGLQFVPAYLGAMEGGKTTTEAAATLCGFSLTHCCPLPVFTVKPFAATSRPVNSSPIEQPRAAKRPVNYPLIE